MYKKIGEKFPYKGKTYEVVESGDNYCEGCGLIDNGCFLRPLWLHCLWSKRPDYKNVIFKEVKDDAI